MKPVVVVAGERSALVQLQYVSGIFHGHYTGRKGLKTVSLSALASQRA
jgi:hypothetical protein